MSAVGRRALLQSGAGISPVAYHTLNATFPRERARGTYPRRRGSPVRRYLVGVDLTAAASIGDGTPFPESVAVVDCDQPSAVVALGSCTGEALFVDCVSPSEVTHGPSWFAVGFYTPDLWYASNVSSGPNKAEPPLDPPELYDINPIDPPLDPPEIDVIGDPPDDPLDPPKLNKTGKHFLPGYIAEQ